LAALFVADFRRSASSSASESRIVLALETELDDVGDRARRAGCEDGAAVDRIAERRVRELSRRVDDVDDLEEATERDLLVRLLATEPRRQPASSCRRSACPR